MKVDRGRPIPRSERLAERGVTIDVIYRALNRYDRARERCKEDLVAPLTAELVRFLGAHSLVEEVRWPFDTEPGIACPKLRLRVSGKVEDLDERDSVVEQLDPTLDGDLDDLASLLGDVLDLYRPYVGCDNELVLNHEGLHVRIMVSNEHVWLFSFDSRGAGPEDHE